MQIPKDWTFESAEVATHFDGHVREQLPWYDLATFAVTHLARHYIPEAGLVYDIGASTGNIGRALKDTLESRSASLVGIEASQNMVQKYQGPGEIVQARAEEFEFQEFDFAVIFLTLQFIAFKHRAKLLETLKSKLRAGGAIVILDKLESRGGYASTALYRLTLAGKLAQGASPAQILEKELSLSGTQRPVSDGLLDGWLEWFRFGEFAGFLFEKK